MTARKEQGQSLSVRFKNETLEWIKTYADENDLSLSSVVNMAIRQFIKTQDALKKMTDSITDPDRLMSAIGSYQKAGGDLSLLTGEQISIDDLLDETEKGD